MVAEVATTLWLQDLSGLFFILVSWKYQTHLCCFTHTCTRTTKFFHLQFKISQLHMHREKTPNQFFLPPPPPLPQCLLNTCTSGIRRCRHGSSVKACSTSAHWKSLSSNSRTVKFISQLINTRCSAGKHECAVYHSAGGALHGGDYSYPWGSQPLSWADLLEVKWVRKDTASWKDIPSDTTERTFSTTQ